MTLAVLSAFSVLVGMPQAPASPPILDQMQPFEGAWKGKLRMSGAEFDVDLKWTRFGGHWAEVSYEYRTPGMTLGYRVLMSPTEDGKGVKVWSFGNDAKVPEEMAGTMEGGSLKVVGSSRNPFLLWFSLSESKELVMKITSSDGARELGRGVLAKVPTPAPGG